MSRKQGDIVPPAHITAIQPLNLIPYVEITLQPGTCWQEKTSGVIFEVLAIQENKAELQDQTGRRKFRTIEQLENLFNEVKENE